MKKISVILAIIVVLCCFGGCDSRTEDDLSKCVNYYQTHLYTAETENFRISLSCGMKEESYIIDNIVGDMVPFALLTLTPLSVDFFSKDYAYKLTGKDGNCEGAFTKDVFGSAFSADIADASALGDIASIIVSTDGGEYSLELSNRMTDKLTYLQVLDIAKTEFANELAAETAGEGFEREICIKFINDSHNSESPYYWYIAFCQSVDDYWAMLVEPTTGKVITKKT